MEKKEFKALVEQYKNEMIELFNLKKDNIVEQVATEDAVIDKDQIEETENNIESTDDEIEEVEDNKEEI